eukprot:scaffold247201_cov20-Prasinocladus_malaysianus.AAC.1
MYAKRFSVIVLLPPTLQVSFTLQIVPVPYMKQQRAWNSPHAPASAIGCTWAPHTQYSKR